jgi:hypothetical protein
LIYARLSSQTTLPVGSFPITRRRIQDGKNHDNAISYDDKLGRSVAELNRGPGAWVSLKIQSAKGNKPISRFHNYPAYLQYSATFVSRAKGYFGASLRTMFQPYALSSELRDLNGRIRIHAALL